MAEKIRLQFFADFTESKNLKNAFRSWLWGGTTYRNIEVVDDDNFTHAVLINLARPDLKGIPKRNVIGLMHEPHQLLNWHSYLDYIEKNIGTYICHDKSFFPNWACFKEGLCYLAPGLPIYSNDVNEYSGEKKFRMNIIASEKGFLPGHALRHHLIRKILQTNLDIHICGRGSGLYSDSRVKGTVNHKADAFVPYEYTIAIENCKLSSWVTEKYYDPIIGNCVPLYWGAPSIDKYFDPTTHIILPDNSVDSMMDVIIDTYKNGSAKSVAKSKIELYNNKNLAHFLWESFNND